MKNLLFLSLVLLGTMLMSFISTESKKAFVQEAKNGLFQVDESLFSCDDLMTYAGGQEVSTVHKKTNKKQFKETNTQRVDIYVNGEEQLLDEILSKYN